MRNKILLVSALALGFSTFAFAGGLPEAMPPAPCATCSDAGVYLGIEGGYEQTNWKNLDGYVYVDRIFHDLDQMSVDHDSGLVGRGFIGYDINKYFAIEGGFTQFNTKRTNIKEEDGTLFSVRTQALDLEFKLKGPITDEFSIYGKLGVDYLMSNISAIKSINMPNRNNFNVLFGAGADYCITPNIIANVEWMRYNGNPKLNIDGNNYFANNYAPYADAFMIGIRYRFDM